MHLTYQGTVNVPRPLYLFEYIKLHTPRKYFNYRCCVNQDLTRCELPPLSESSESLT